MSRSVSMAGVWRAGASGGNVGGASSLSTPGSIAYVASTGVLGQDAGQLHWDATNNRLGIKTDAPLTDLQIGNASTAGTRAIFFSPSAGNPAIVKSLLHNASLQFDAVYGLQFYNAGTAVTHLSYNGSSVGIGPSNTSPTGTLHVYDATPTAGATTLTVRAGAGQSSTRILDVIAPSYGVKVTASGEFVLYDVGGNDRLYFHPTIFALGSTTAMAWASDTSVYSAKDLGLARAGAGLLKVTDGSTGLGGIAIASQTPASAAATGTQGQIAWDADYIYVCTATDTWKRVAIATWP